MSFKINKSILRDSWKSDKEAGLVLGRTYYELSCKEDANILASDSTLFQINSLCRSGCSIQLIKERVCFHCIYVQVKHIL